MRTFILGFVFLFFYSCNTTKTDYDFTTTFEKSNGLKTATYAEVIDFYKNLALTHPEITINEMGETDSGFPLHMVVYNVSGKVDFNNNKKSVILINNGIHPGEPDGVDASMLLLRDLVQNKKFTNLYKNTVLVIIPMYNIGGALNRNSTSRANQNGPEAYGFRGNARNYDLNRDFIKADTKNTKSFAQIFHLINPDVFIDTHVSNGADYQYTLTHLFTQYNKLSNDLGDFIEHNMRPQIETALQNKNLSITPYVNVWGTTPDKGFSQFFDYPRYSTGYTTLFNSLGVMIETHMLKPYKQRVEQTFELLECIINYTNNNYMIIKNLRKDAVSKILEKKTYPIQYALDATKFNTLQFNGFEAEYLSSNVTNGKRLYYNRNKPYTKHIKYFNIFTVTDSITIPKAYILKKGWWNIIDRLQNNNITYTVFKKDSIIEAEKQTIKYFETRKNPYEGHYLHFNTKTSSVIENVHVNKGDLYIPVDQKGIRYIIETLEASATDSFFNWNFFDTLLQQKEGYSAYVFEDKAESFLQENPEIRKALNLKIKNDTSFAKNPRAQLNFVYKHSPYYEKSHLTLPVYKVY